MKYGPSTSTLALALDAALWSLATTALPWVVATIYMPFVFEQPIDFGIWRRLTILFVGPVCVGAWWLFWRINVGLRARLREIDRLFGSGRAKGS